MVSCWPVEQLHSGKRGAECPSCCAQRGQRRRQPGEKRTSTQRVWLETLQQHTRYLHCRFTHTRVHNAAQWHNNETRSTCTNVVRLRTMQSWSSVCEYWYKIFHRCWILTVARPYAESARYCGPTIITCHFRIQRGTYQDVVSDMMCSLGRKRKLPECINQFHR